MGDPLGDYGNNSGSVITFYSNHTYHFVTLGVEVGAGTWERPLALGGNQAGQVLLTDEDTGEVEYYTIHPDGYILHSFTGEKFKPTE